MVTERVSVQRSELPNPPKAPECRNARRVLEYTHRTAWSFLTIFDSKREGPGAPTTEQSDLLRAMLVFTSAGIDSMAKHLVQDALPALIKKDLQIYEIFKVSVSRRMEKNTQTDYKLLVDILLAQSPIDEMIELFVKELTEDSLQSANQLTTVASYFNIPSHSIAPDKEDLQRTFNIRNEIIHEMDINFNQPSRNRRPRRRDNMIAATDQLLEVGQAFLAAVDAKLG